MSEDITWCGKWDCENLECFRNPKHIKLDIPHSFALLENTEFCIKTKEEKKEE